eukprot:CAMPEP_0182586002 /NCGR_PEP_ID=MMETSP1324-20130603/61608_1 /TAXON_ID=236786 /ORGANISM="Florenciella sp., Strain RCC1587" /LENGTH=44 /DNA_ID= /DNA_START= /DNA_END= /DNA_ORIENTATION=
MEKALERRSAHMYSSAALSTVGQLRASSPSSSAIQAFSRSPATW